MALTRAHVVAARTSLREEARALIGEVLAKPRNEARLLEDLTEMRGLIEQESRRRDIWDVKLIPGGLIDIEFIAQFLSPQGPAPAAGCRRRKMTKPRACSPGGSRSGAAKPTHSECTSTDATLRSSAPASWARR